MDKIMRMIRKSPEWGKATKEINKVVDRMNKDGYLMTAKERETLAELRVLAVIRNDPEVFKAYSNYVYKKINAQEGAS